MNPSSRLLSVLFTIHSLDLTKGFTVPSWIVSTRENVLHRVHHAHNTEDLESRYSSPFDDFDTDDEEEERERMWALIANKNKDTQSQEHHFAPATTPNVAENVEHTHHTHHHELAPEERLLDAEDMKNKFLKASQSSFKHVEGTTDSLLAEQPLLALAIFVGAGLLVAYISGFFFLGGYISSPNPIENGEVPYWDEEITEELPSDIMYHTQAMFYYLMKL